MTDRELRDCLRMAYYAAKNSDDQRTQNGAVIVSGDKHVTGWNHFAIKQHDYPDDAGKAKWMVHAEESVIFAAARQGLPTLGAVMYCPWAPCTRCARAIIDAGIDTLVTHHAMMLRTYAKYVAEVDAGLRMLDSAGVKHISWQGRIHEVDNLMNGETWLP